MNKHLKLVLDKMNKLEDRVIQLENRKEIEELEKRLKHLMSLFTDKKVKEMFLNHKFTIFSKNIVQHKIESCLEQLESYSLGKEILENMIIICEEFLKKDEFVNEYKEIKEDNKIKTKKENK